MKRFIIFLIVLSLGCRFEKKTEQRGLSMIQIPTDTIKAMEMAIEVFDYEGLRPFLHQTDDKIHIVNFWATWCAPCIKELPYFEKLGLEQPEIVEVMLVSLDMPSMWTKQLLPFIKKKKLLSKVVVLDDPKQNSWIPQIDENWSGAIPATLIYNRDKRKFYEKPFTYSELVTEINTFK